MGRKVNLSSVIKSCEIQFGRGEAAIWTHSDFIALNQDILQNTKVNISINTLKRIFGKLSVDEKYIPQEATIEALQKFSENAFSENGKILVEVQSDIKHQSSKIKKRSLIYFITLILVGIIGFIVWYILNTTSFLTASIKLKKLEGVLPSTAVFELQIPQTNDSLFVNFGDKSPLVYINRGQKLITHNYLLSGVFRVALLVQKSVIAETNISISSNKWIAISYHDELRNHFYQIPAVKTTPDSLFNLTNSQLNKVGLDTVQRIFTRLYNYTAVNYSKDDFTYETTFKNPSRRNGISCNSTQFQISGMNSMIRFKLSSEGCSSRVINVLSEKKFDGDKNDLSQFVVEQENWNTVKMINRNKHVSLFVNGKLLYKGSYQKPLGEIKGLFIEFEGNGFVKTCNLTAKNGRNLYHF